MRKIPIYRTDKEELEYELLYWEPGIINQENINQYIDQICTTVKCLRKNHLEISRNSDQKIGKALRTASLYLKKGSEIYSSESLYQGSKSFKIGENCNYLYTKEGNEALKEKANWKSKKIIEIDFFGYSFPTEALSDLHDVAYWFGLEQTHLKIIEAMKILKKKEVNFFTDSFDSPGKNSQSKSFSQYYFLWKNGSTVWDHLSENAKKFLKIIKEDLKKEKSKSLF